MNSMTDSNRKVALATEGKTAERATRRSERRYPELEGELAHTNRLATLGQLSAAIVHEVKQPMSAAASNAQAGLRWLEAQPPRIDEARRALRRVLENSIRASEITDGIRSLVKKTPPRREWLQIDEVIRGVIGLVRRKAIKSGVSVRAQFAQTPSVHGDRVQLQQVILNLLNNAVEAMKDPTITLRELHISTETRDSTVVVKVRDSGRGITPGDATRIFDAFYTTKPCGLGMGLAICTSIIEVHGGQLSVFANEPRGTTLQFGLPVHPHGLPPRPLRRRSGAERRRRRTRSHIGPVKEAR